MLKVIAGDWKENTNVFVKRGAFTQKLRLLRFQKWIFFADRYAPKDIQSAEIITADTGASLSGKLGWGALGAVTFGPAGAIVGSIAGGNKNDRLAAVVFKDGKRAVLRGKAKDIEPLLAAGFNWNRA